MKKGTKVVFWGWTVLLAIVFLCGTWGNAGAQGKKTIRIGHIVHVTGGMAAGQFGLMEGFEDGLQYCNENMDLKGVKLQAVQADGGSEVAKAMAVFKQMTEGDDAIAVMVGEHTGVGIALKNWNIKKKIANIEGGSDDSFYILPSWTFSSGCPYVNQVGAWIDYYMSEVWPKKGLKRAPRFAFFTWDIAAGRSIVTKNTIEYIKSKGIEYMGEEYVPMVPTDVSAQVMRLKQKEVDFTMGLMYHNALAVLLKEIDKQGLTDRIEVGMTYVNSAQGAVELAKETARNTYQTALFYETDDWMKMQPNVAAMWKKNKREKVRLYTYIMGFDRAAIAAEAVRMAIHRVGADKVDGQAVYESLTKMKKFSAGTGPAHSFSETKRYGQDSVLIMRYNNNKVNFLKEIPVPNLTPVKH